MLVSDAVAAALAELGADTVFGVVGSGNFHVTNALIARGARFVAARHEGGAACMADGWARTAGRPGLALRAPGPGADQRADRHHRGGQEPHAAAGARRGRGRRGGAVQLPHRRGRARRRRRRGAGAAALPRLGRRRRRARLPDRAAGAAHRGAGHAAGRAGGACDPPARSPAGPPLGPPAPAAEAATAWLAAAGGGQRGRCSSPGGARGGGARARRRTWNGSRTPAARCSPPRPRPRACSGAARGTWT